MLVRMRACFGFEFVPIGYLEVVLLLACLRGISFVPKCSKTDTRFQPLIMRGQLPSCQLYPPAPIPSSRFAGRGGGDTRMWEMYTEYADIAAADEPLGRIKARLAALSAYAESQGLTGHAAFDGLRRLVSELHGELLDMRQFTLLYRFVFFMCRERGQKSIPVSTAVDAWKLSLTGRFRLLDQWCAFVQVHHRHSISEDTWRQVLEFSRSVHEDLSNYDPEGAWPVLVDEFVESMYRKSSCPSCSESATVCKCELDVSSKPVIADDCPTTISANRANTLPGMVASAGSKRRRKDSKDEAAQVESVDNIAQLLAEMPSPISCKRAKMSGTAVELQDLMEEVPVGVDQVKRLWERKDHTEFTDDDMLWSGSLNGSMTVGHLVGRMIFYPAHGIHGD